MAISSSLEEAINSQITLEHYSSFIYLSMSAWADGQGLKGVANWYRVQSREELNHAWILYQYLLERRGTVRLAGVSAPPTCWDSLEALALAGIAAEEEVTSKLHELATLAMAEHDHAAYQLLQWFVAEQVEEEANAHDLLDRIRLASGTPAGILFLDQQLATRVYTPPTGTPVAFPAF